MTGSGTQVDVVFSQPVEATTAITTTNYVLDNGVTITSAALTNSTTVTLTTNQALNAGTSYTLTVSNVQDTATFTNTISPTDYTFIAGP